MEREFGASEAEQQAVIEWFKSKDIELTCSQCGRKRFNTGRPVVAPTVREDGSLDTHYALSFLPMICAYCAHVEWFYPWEMGAAFRHLAEGR